MFAHKNWQDFLWNGEPPIQTHPSVEIFHHRVVGVLVGDEEGALDVAAVRVLTHKNVY